MNRMTPDEFVFLKAIRREPIPRTPLWIMRQAGRYLPEYRKIRKKRDFLSVCKDPELAAEVTLQPMRRFDLDAAILFSDILILPEAMGIKLEFINNRGPRLWPRIIDESRLQILSCEPIIERLQFVVETIKRILAALDGKKPLIGFSGSPFTLAAYMIEGTPTRNFKYIKTMLYKKSSILPRLLDMLTEAVIHSLTLQIAAGVHAVQIFDTWGGILPIHLFDSFSGKYMKKIAEELKTLGVPVILFSKGGLEPIRMLADSAADMLGVDWMTEMAEARDVVDDRMALQGNLDPGVLYGDNETIRREIKKILEVFKGNSGHVFNLGHGIMPDADVDKVSFLVNEVRAQSEVLRNTTI
jgi:uroporphyrinogen decarboxylase